MEHAPDYLVFTDLDGTLLDKVTYSFEEALSAFHALKERGIPVIIVTSKTEPEVRALQEEMAWHDPAIIENGGAVLYPDGTVQVLGRPVEEILTFFTGQARAWGLKGIHTMGVEEIVALTGLDPRRAAWARERQWTLPFVTQNDTTATAFAEKARDAGFNVVRGGRFYHIMGAEQDKGRAVEVVVDRYATRYPEEVIETVGLGDAPNDLPFLERVKIPILTQKPDGTWLDAPFPCVKTPFAGPMGWSWAIEKLLRGDLP